MAQHPEVLIVGGGVIGLTTAYFLAKDGMTVEVLDKGELGTEASWAGAGIIPPGNPDGAVSAYDRLRAVSSSMYFAFSQELHSLTGIDNGYRVCGQSLPASREPGLMWRPTSPRDRFNDASRVPERLHQRSGRVLLGSCTCRRCGDVGVARAGERRPDCNGSGWHRGERAPPAQGQPFRLTDSLTLISA